MFFVLFYYRYEEEHSMRCHWSERHGNREPERHIASTRDIEGWGEEDRRHRRRRDTDRDRWCCPDWEQGEKGNVFIYEFRFNLKQLRFR